MSDQNSIEDFDVVVIGGGLSGLYAASILQEHNVKFCVLEARNRVGGRTLTKKDDKVGYVDLGGSYVGPTQHYVHKLIRKFNLKTYKVHDEGFSVYLNQNERILHESDSVPNLNSESKKEVEHVMNLIDEMCEQIPQDEPWNGPNAYIWDRITFWQFLEQNCKTQEAKDYMSVYMGSCTSCEPYESSLLWTLWFIKQCDGIQAMYNITDSAQDSKLVGGTQQISEKLCELIGKDKVKLNKAVVQICKQMPREGLKESRSIVRTLDGSVYQTKFIIMAIPLSLQHKINYNPPLPSLYNQLIQKIPMGSVIKSIVYYEEPFWRHQSFNGNLLINCAPEVGPITLTLDDTKPDGAFPSIVGFIIGERANKMLAHTQTERLALICASYARAFNSHKALKPVHYEEKNWMSEQFTGGGFTAFGTPGFLTTYGKMLREPLLGNIYLAGTETATHWSGYMDGALQAGERAAIQVVSKLQNSKTSKEVHSTCDGLVKFIEHFQLNGEEATTIVI